MNIQIRKAEVADIPYILLIEKLANVSNIVKGRSNIKLEKLVYKDYTESAAYMKSKLESSIGYVTIYNDFIIGCGFIVDNLNYYLLQSVYIEPSFQGKEVGKQLIEFFISKARKEGKLYIELETGTAENFYRRLGFVCVPDSCLMRYKIAG
jgi:GNAT superfamily N-acetyltransferase